MAGSSATVHGKGLSEKNIDLLYDMVYAEKPTGRTRPL
jgi:hypothetical protein